MKHRILLLFGKNQDTRQVFNEITQEIINHLHTHPGSQDDTVLLVHEDLKERLFSIWEEHYLRTPVPPERGSRWQRFIFWVARVTLRKNIVVQTKTCATIPTDSPLRKLMEKRQVIPIQGRWFAVETYGDPRNTKNIKEN